MKILITFAVAWMILAGIMIYIASKAPKGYEDEDGFHYDE